MDSIPELSSEAWAEIRSKQPISAALVEAICGRVKLIADKFQMGNYSLDKANSDLEIMNKEIRHLSTWIVGAPVEKSQRDICRFVDGWVAFAQSISLSGYEVAQIGKRAEEIVRKKPRGRPPVKRPIAVRALELKMADRKLTWDDVATKVCDCGKKSHDEYCKQAIRVAVEELKKTLRAYKIPYCHELPLPRR